MGWREFTCSYVGPVRDTTHVQSDMPTIEIPSILRQVFSRGYQSEIAFTYDQKEKLLLQMDPGNGNAYRFTKATKEPLLEMPTALDPWCVDRRDYIWGEICDLEECSIPQQRSLPAVHDLWARYHAHIAMDSLYLYRPQPVTYEYQRIYVCGFP
jgi:hypothetical protein